MLVGRTASPPSASEHERHARETHDRNRHRSARAGQNRRLSVPGSLGLFRAEVALDRQPRNRHLGYDNEDPARASLLSLCAWERLEDEYMPFERR